MLDLGGKCKASIHPAFCRPLRLSAEPSRRFEIIAVGQVGEGMSPRGTGVLRRGSSRWQRGRSETNRTASRGRSTGALQLTLVRPPLLNPLQHQLRHGPHGVDTSRNQQGGGDGLLPPLEIVADLLLGTDEGGVLNE